jgi:hypothetical protein
MKASEFCYWLQGFFEIENERNPNVDLTKKQADVIQRHLALVFKHDIDPSQGTPEHQAELQAIHDGKSKIGGTGPNGEIFRC